MMSQSHIQSKNDRKARPTAMQSILRFGFVPILMLVAFRLKGKFSATKYSGPGELLDEATGISWPIKDPADKRMILLGTGVRAKNFGVANVNVYSASLYAHAKNKGLKKALKKSPSGQDLYDNIATGAYAKRVYLHFVRNVGQKKIVEALTAVSGVSKAALDEFGDAIKEAMPDGATKGQVLSLFWPKSGSLIFAIDGKEVGTFRTDSKLPGAVFNMYLGKKPVAPALLKSIEANVDNAISMSK